MHHHFIIRYALSEDELQNIRDGLKKRWDMINRTYQNLTHITKIDTVGLKRKYILFL